MERKLLRSSSGVFRLFVLRIKIENVCGVWRLFTIDHGRLAKKNTGGLVSLSYIYICFIHHAQHVSILMVVGRYLALTRVGFGRDCWCQTYIILKIWQADDVLVNSNNTVQDPLGRRFHEQHHYQEQPSTVQDPWSPESAGLRSTTQKTKPRYVHTIHDTAEREWPAETNKTHTHSLLPAKKHSKNIYDHPPL